MLAASRRRSGETGAQASQMKFDRTDVTTMEALGRLPGVLRVVSRMALLVQGIIS